MRIRKDSTSWHAGGVVRRDERSAKPDDRHRPVAGKKDTKRWCGGKLGREHELEVFERSWSFSKTPFYERCCKRCGKNYGTWYPSLSKVFRQKPPEWFKEYTLARPGDNRHS